MYVKWRKGQIANKVLDAIDWKSLQPAWHCHFIGSSWKKHAWFSTRVYNSNSSSALLRRATNNAVDSDSSSLLKQVSIPQGRVSGLQGGTIGVCGCSSDGGISLSRVLYSASFHAAATCTDLTVLVRVVVPYYSSTVMAKAESAMTTMHNTTEAVTSVGARRPAPKTHNGGLYGPSLDLQPVHRSYPPRNRLCHFQECGVSYATLNPPQISFVFRRHLPVQVEDPRLQGID